MASLYVIPSPTTTTSTVGNNQKMTRPATAGAIRKAQKSQERNKQQQTASMAAMKWSGKGRSIAGGHCSNDLSQGGKIDGEFPVAKRPDAATLTPSVKRSKTPAGSKTRRERKAKEKNKTSPDNDVLQSAAFLVFFQERRESKMAFANNTL